ncbi:MAG: hypothetical protein KatS3mg031_1437 [Chitinophagales bacterium]|nr:MAG: hypothetical protein KatS3mg031_1437 [Chitinophagales bacterium]
MLTRRLCLFFPFCILASVSGQSQCIPPQPQNLQATLNPFTGNVTVQWRVPCPSPCNNSASTSTLFFIGFYSQQSAAPNSLDGEYGFTTFVAVGCPYTELWDGFYRDPTSTADPKRSPCVWTLMGQDVNPLTPGFEKSFSLQDICNNAYGYGAGIMQAVFPAYAFCSGVTYDVKVWTIEIDVPPNGNVTSQTIACNDLYLDESSPAVVTSAFTYPGFIAPIAAPLITITGSASSDGVYQGVNNRILIDCTDTFSFSYQVTPGCNFTESVAAYFQISPTYTYGAGVYNPSDWGLNTDDWYIFFANNIVDPNTGQPLQYVGNNQFASFVVSEDVEVCILTQDPCNGSSAKTCIQFDAVDLDTVIADFSYNLVWSNNCDSFLVEFVNNTTGATDYYWDFGDGSFSTDSSLTHLFTGGGPFDVMLAAIHTGWCGNNDTVTHTLSFTPAIDTAQAVISFFSQLTPTCDSLIVSFTTQTVQNANLLWDFGNGVTSTLLSPTVTYTVPDTYQVSLIVIPSSSCLLPDTFTEQIVFAPPLTHTHAEFDYNLVWTNNCDSFMVEFINLSTGASAYYWDFGNGSFSSDSSLTQLFSSGGPFTVTLTALHSGACGTDDSTQRVLTFSSVLDTLQAAFSFNTSYSPACDSLHVILQATSDKPAIYLWDFGNGLTATGPSVSVTYADSGSYPVTLIASPLLNCTLADTVSQNIFFNPVSYNATARFRDSLLYSNRCDSFIVAFINLSSGGTSYFWDFGNGLTSTDTAPVMTYAAGSYQVMLQVNDHRQCARGDTAYLTLLFTPEPDTAEAVFTYQIHPGCNAVELTIANLSTGNYTYQWTIGTQNLGAYLPNAPFVFTEPDMLQVTLTASGNTACVSEDIHSEVIAIPQPYGYPIAAFGMQPPTPHVMQEIAFIDSSIGAAPDSYYWSFGDGNFSTDTHPKHSYQQPGEYEICLYLSNTHGCPDSTCKRIQIDESVIIDLPTAFSPNGDNHNDIFRVRYDKQSVERLNLKIFNRWGELVFESNDPDYGWDGTYKEEPQEVDVYVWLLEAALKNGKNIFRKGNLTLLR